MEFELLNKTESLCPVCLAKIDAEVRTKEDKVVIVKRCSEHGEFIYPHAWDNPSIYEEIVRLSRKKEVRFRDTTIDVTSECNMNCSFCFSFSRNKYYNPTIPDLMNKIKKLKETGGDVILYGGEPTLRKDLCCIVKDIKKLGFSVNIATNGLELNNSLLLKLDKMKLDKIQLQFDSLNDRTYEIMRNKKMLEKKLEAIRNINKTNIEVTLFVVLMKGINEDQIDKIMSFAGKNSGRIRSVIFTTVSPEGADSSVPCHLTGDEIIQIIENKFKISKEDFIKCTEFDITLSNFLYKIRNVRRRSPASCEMLCYIYIRNSALIPLSRLIDLEKLSKLLDDIMSMRDEGKLKTFLHLFSEVRKIQFDIILLPFLFRVISSLIYSFLTGKPLKGKFKNTFGVIIAPSQNRYNIDYRLIENCNLYADTKNGEFISFCEKLIFSAGPKSFVELSEHIEQT